MKTTKLSQLTGIKPDVRKYKKSPDFVLSRCPIGIEIEAENIRHPFTLGDEGQPRPRLRAPNPRAEERHAGYWKITTDGSLRNEGAEFISDPIWGEDINKALDSLHELFAASKNEPDFSERTSVHIHLDVRSLDTMQLFNLLVLVIIFERSLVKYCGGVREENIFCLPFYKSESSIKELSNIVRDGADFLTVVERTFKYNGFNIRPVVTQGSVEFRYHYGTMDKERLKEWINIIYCLKREAVKVEDVLMLPNIISQMGVEAYTNKVFGKYAKMLDTTNLNDSVYEGIRLAQEVIYAERHSTMAKKVESYDRINEVAKFYKKKPMVSTVAPIPSFFVYDEEANTQLQNEVANAQRIPNGNMFDPEVWVQHRPELRAILDRAVDPREAAAAADRPVRGR